MVLHARPRRCEVPRPHVRSPLLMTDAPSGLSAPPSDPPLQAPGATPSSEPPTHAATSVLGPEERARALRAGSTPVPRNFFLLLIIGFAVLGIGGLIADHFFGNTGQAAPTATTTTIPSSAGAPPPSSPLLAGTQVRTPTGEFLGLSSLEGGHAPALTLGTANGSTWTPGMAKGEPVVLTFLNFECNDICPVLSAEIREASGIVRRSGHRVQFVVVNSDPLETSFAPAPPAAAALDVGHGAGITLLSGSLAALDRVWTSYGLTVEVQNSTRLVSHNNVMYFIDPTGRLRYRSTPFGNESTLGTYSLSPSEIGRYAQGIATTVESVERETP